MVQATKLPVNTSVDAMQLAETMFGKGVTLVSASYTGHADAKGIYTDGHAVSPGVMPADSGIILSTGLAQDFTNGTDSGSANQSGGRSTDHSMPGDPLLNDIAGESVTTRDAAILEATFIPEGSFLTMQLVFSSEEYPEYVGGGYNDAVGIFVNGQQAMLTIGSGDISIDNINDQSNQNLYVENPTGDENGQGSLYNTEMDGFTITLTLKAPVNPGVENTIWIGIADAGDGQWDSNLLIAADSVQTEVIAYDDAINIGQLGTESLAVLDNDTAGEGATLTITHINGQAVQPGDSVTLMSGTIVTLNADGTLGFVAAEVLGEESLNYTIADQDGTTDVGFISINVTCFARGALILTPTGEVPVESLAAGDLVMTRDRGAQPLRWIGATRVDAARLHDTPNLRPIRIRAGALGDGVPARDLVVSPQHRILLRSRIAQKMFATPEILVAAKQLLQVEGIDIAHDLDEVEYFHFLFDQHEIVISNGAETESLYLGPEAVKSVGPAAIAEICALFPELRDGTFEVDHARFAPAGRPSRRLVVRHIQNNRPLVDA